MSYSRHHSHIALLLVLFALVLWFLHKRAAETAAASASGSAGGAVAPVAGVNSKGYAVAPDGKPYVPVSMVVGSTAGNGTNTGLGTIGMLGLGSFAGSSVGLNPWAVNSSSVDRYDASMSNPMSGGGDSASGDDWAHHFTRGFPHG